MGKIIFLRLLLVLAMVITVTSLLEIQPSVIKSEIEKIPSEIEKDKDSSSEAGNDDDDDDSYSKSDESSELEDDGGQILCNAIVRATHDLYLQQGKPANEITTYLTADCSNLENEELIEQCRVMVTQYGTKIYKYMIDGITMSQICKKIEDNYEMGLDDEAPPQCSQKSGNKCQCCKMHVEKRKMRLRFIVKLMAKRRMQMCNNSPRPERCRRWIRRREQMVLKKINKICPYLVCKHLGYCESKIDIDIDFSSQWIEQVNQQLETYLTENVCGQFDQLQGICNHLAASTSSPSYVKLYRAVLDNDTQWIDSGLTEIAQAAKAGASGDLCDKCKDAVQSSVNTYLQLLETTRSSLDSICEKCPAKDKCEAFFNDRLDAMKAYLQSLKPAEFCSTIHLCTSSPLAVPYSLNNNGVCDACVQRLQPRKDAALEAINRLADSFTSLCAQSSIPQCLDFVTDLVTEVRSFINEFNIADTCQAMGLCKENTVQDISSYEQAFVDEFGKVCTMMGPLEALCQQVVQGNSKQVQTVSLNDINIDDFFLDCEEPTDDENAVAPSSAMFIAQMIETCKRCPARDQCEKFWQEKKACWDAKIDKICPKKVCIRMGYCQQKEISSACAYMGPFKQLCQQTSNAVGKFFDQEHQQLIKVFTNHVAVQTKDEKKEQTTRRKLPGFQMQIRQTKPKKYFL